jgi:hypothetical protein
MKGPFQSDVFLSHNPADKPRVRRLAERLRAAGGRAPALWFDECVSQPQDDIYLAIEHGLEASRTLVRCLSPADSLALPTSEFAPPAGVERSTNGRGNMPLRDPGNAGRPFESHQVTQTMFP